MAKKLIDATELRGMDLEGRIAALRDVLKVDPAELRELSYESPGLVLADKAERLARIIYESLVHQGESKHTALSCIHSGVLGAVICRGFEDYGKENCNPTRAMENALSRRFAKERKAFEAETNSRACVMSLLRNHIYEDVEHVKLLPNVSVAYEIWGSDANFSYFDLARGIKLPYKIDAEIAFLLGVGYFGAYYHDAHTAEFSFKKEHQKFFDKVVYHIVKDRFNLSMSKREIREKGYCYVARSMAMHSWLSGVAGYEGNIDKRKPFDFDRIPQERIIPLQDAKEIFLYGVIARKGVLKGHRSNGTRRKKIVPGPKGQGRGLRGVVYVAKAAPAATEYLGSLSNELGFEGQFNVKQGRFYLVEDDCNRILGSMLLEKHGFHFPHIGGFVHPGHLDFIYSLYRGVRKGK